HAHGHAAQKDHEVSHGFADAHATHAGHAVAVADDDHGGGHGHGPWHGPHESPRPMTVPLMALAVGAIVAGFIGIPAALGGGNTIEHFLEPSFTAEVRLKPDTTEASRSGAEAASGSVRLQPDHEAASEHDAEPHASRLEELGLMGFSVVIALI